MPKILLPILLLALVLPVTAMLATGTVNGTVVDADGKVLANQKVRIKKVLSRDPIGKDSQTRKLADSLTAATPTTDKDGKFSQSLEAGDYWAEAGSKTLGYAKEQFEVKAGETTEVKLALKKE
jgi:hypothetical protein